MNPLLTPLRTGPTDHDLDLSVAAMLRFGVTLAAIVVFAGGVLLLGRHPFAPAPDYRHFHPAGPALSTLKGIFSNAFHLDPPSIIQAGLILLIATPVARVVLCTVGFARQRDRLYVAISALVLIVLIYALSKGSH
jgi:uncharacterized membrane protein